MSRQFSTDDIENFYHTLQDIAQCEDPDLALSTLMACCSDIKSLIELLMQYHDNHVVFKPIIDQDKRELLEYLYNINPSIITLPIQKGDFITLSNLAIHGIYPKIVTWLKEKEPEFFAKPKSTKEWAEQALAHLENDNYQKFLELIGKMSFDDAKEFFQFEDGQKILEAAYDQDRLDYFIALIESHIEKFPNILRIKVYQKSILKILLDDPESYTALLDIILSDHYLDNLTDEEHTLLQSLSLNFYRQYSFRNLALHKERTIENVILTNNDLKYSMFGVSEDIILSKQDTDMLKQYIDPHFWPDLSALEAFLHTYFFEKLSERNMPLHPIVANHTPIQPEQLVQLAEGNPIYYITGLTFQNGEQIPSLNLKATAYHVQSVIIPINHQIEGHYGILILDLTKVANKIWEPGENNYFIEPYSAEIKTKNIHNRLAKAISLLTPSTKKLPIKVISLGQKDNSSCSDYVIATIMNAVLHDAQFIEQIENKFLDESMIMKIRLIMIVTLGFDYFKLQLTSQIPKDETVLKEVFNRMSEIVSQWKTPRAEPSLAKQEIYPDINLQRYKKYGDYLETGEFLNPEHSLTASGKPKKKLPMDNYKRPGSPPADAQSKRKPTTIEHGPSSALFKRPSSAHLFTAPPSTPTSTFSLEQEDWQIPRYPQTMEPFQSSTLFMETHLTEISLTEAPLLEASTEKMDHTPNFPH